jgi:signal recognition particle receptor subunit beta
MAAFDSPNSKIVVRVVFDGPGFAGKTTNVRQLHGFFTARRRGELVVPEERDGRTQVFDWMHLDGGLVHGYGLRCQLVTVPGQAVLSKRRWALLGSADVVVFVCDSTPSGVEDAAPMFGTLLSHLAERWGAETPLVVQANKQDVPDALEPEELRASLNVPPGVPVVPATAATGVGVRETVVLAIREAANRVQRQVLEHGLGSITDAPDRPQDLAKALLALPEVRPTPDAPRVAPRGDPSLTGEGVQTLQPTSTPKPRHHAPADTGRSLHTAPATDTREPAPPEPVLDPEVPPGLIWPAATGRDILRRACAAGRPAHRADLAGQSGLATGSGGRETFVFEAGMWCLKTSARRRYRDIDEGRAALLRLARCKATLGNLLPPNTVVSLHPDPDGWHRLWTVSPWMTPLRAVMLHAASTGQQDVLEHALACYARGTAAAVQLAVRRGLVLDVHPSNFACIGDRIHYMDDDVDDGTTVPTLGHALLQRVVEYPLPREAWDRYMAHFLEALRAALEADEIRSARVVALVGDTPTQSEVARGVRDRLASSLQRLEMAAVSSPDSGSGPRH